MCDLNAGTLHFYNGISAWMLSHEPGGVDTTLVIFGKHC